MSRSSEPKLTHPCQNWLKWEGKHGAFSRWDKETETSVMVGKPFTFLVLDQDLHCIVGYDKETQQGYSSNEVRNPAKELLNLRLGKTVIASGFWKTDLKGKFAGSKYARSVYIAYYDENTNLVIGNIKFTGSALTGLSDKAIQADLEDAKVNQKIQAKELKQDLKDVPLEAYSREYLNSIGWMNFSNARKDLNSIAVCWTDSIADSNGETDFFRPIFTAKKVSDETNNLATQLDKELQEYLTVYFNKNALGDNQDSASEEYATSAQLKMLYDLANQTGNLELDICDLYGAANFESMTKQQASLAINQMQSNVDTTERAIAQDVDVSNDDIAF
jgi:hypothetical protein